MNLIEYSCTFQAVGKEVGPTENVFISPFNVAAALAMVHAGARGNTAQQIRTGLHLDAMTNDQINSQIGNLVRHTKVSTPIKTDKNEI